MVGALLALGVCSGCRAAMTTTLENHGDPLDVSYRCGDAMYQTTLASGASVSWAPVANSCSLDVRSPTAGRRFTLRNQCRSSHGCSVGVIFPVVAASPGAPTTTAPSGLSGSGQIDVVGSAVTVTATPPP